MAPNSSLPHPSNPAITVPDQAVGAPNSGVIRVVNSEGVFNIDELDLALFALLS